MLTLLQRMLFGKHVSCLYLIPVYVLTQAHLFNMFKVMAIRLAQCLALEKVQEYEMQNLSLVEALFPSKGVQLP